MASLINLVDVKKYYKVKSSPFQRERRNLKAVDGVSLGIEPGECLGLVGESGCGKTTIGRLIVKLEKPSHGQVLFKGRDISEYGRQSLQTFRRLVQMIFQDPFSSLNPRKTIGSTIGEPLLIHRMGTRREREEKVLGLMSEVGLRPEHYGRYPHEFSGGQRQRIGIARALALNPELIVADEPVSALDVSIQAQVINLLKELQARFNLTYLFIAHDLSLVRHVSDRIAVMYLGRLVEIISREEFGRSDHHPYTLALLASIPEPRPRSGKKIRPLLGEVGSPINPPSGCTFHPRCAERTDICQAESPELREVSPRYLVACHHR